MTDHNGQAPGASSVDLELDRAHSARMYDYYLGGTTNFTADREAVGRVLTAFPGVRIAARTNREFMHRATRWAAENGLRQFLDIGTGIPTSPNLHEVVQLSVPTARVVYADNDPIVLAHAQALLRSTPQGRTAYVEADATDPDTLLKASALCDTLDLSRPVALSLNALLHFVTDADDAHSIIERYKDALAPGSTLALSHATPDFDAETMNRMIDIYTAAGTPLQFRTRAEFSRFFDGWELVEPGVTVSHRWRPDDHRESGQVSDADAACYVAVARKP
ncbi:SAM-dependent methyltransferase [Streptomyces sp. NBC_01197]|uniref:SAM-dependent methyltransferase n=1 Tax=Streptomyces sp. NBC_01197 TaxID=2903768 RepID=UPI002E10A1B2|nr:SAM-dependent methyltransferase [Streptomyces sp. NBC_01197]